MDDSHVLLFLGVVIGLFLAAIIFIIVEDASSQVKIDMETANDICKQLTGNESSVAKDSWKDDVVGNEGKLICITPSFDSTQNIIIKSNQDIN